LGEKKTTSQQETTAVIVPWQGRVMNIFIDNIYYSPVNTTPFPAGGVSCLEQHVSIILSCT
jgi:hypothetical protein